MDETVGGKTQTEARNERTMRNAREFKDDSGDCHLRVVAEMYA
jgi:hypothetical protein